MEVVSTSFTIMTSIMNSIVIVPAFGSIADVIEDKYELYQDACSLRDTPFYSLQDTDINAFTNPLSFQLDAIKIQLLDFGYDEFQINSFIDRFEVSIKHIVELFLDDDNNILNEVIRKPDMFRGYIFAKSALTREKYPAREQQCFDILIRCVADEYVLLAPKSPDFDVIALEGTIIALAQIFYEQGVKDQARVLGEDHPDTLTTRHNLAYCYQEAGRLDEAIDLFEQVTKDRIRVLGEDHPDTLWTRCDLAKAYKDAGRIGEAIDLYENLVSDRIRVLGEDHPDTLITRNQLANVYRFAGRLDEAIDLYENLVSDRIRVLGEDHPDTLWTRCDLAKAYKDAGRTDEAITLYKNLLSDCIRSLARRGPYPATLWTRCYVAEAYKDAGRTDEAITQYEKLVPDCIRSLARRGARF